MFDYMQKIADYSFSNDEPDLTSAAMHMFIHEIGPVHGVGGKFMEKIIQLKMNINVWGEDTIHDYDGSLDGRPVEMKMETVNNSGKLNLMSSYKGMKTDLYRKDYPLIVNFALDPETSKVMWVTTTDTKKITSDSKLWRQLSRQAPRTSFAQYSKQDEKALVVNYINKTICAKYKDSPGVGNKRCINKKFLSFLTENCAI